MQINIKQNLVKNTRENHNFFQKYIFLKVFGTGTDLAQKKIWAEAHCSCMNRRRELIHARFSCSEQRGRRRRRRGEGRLTCDGGGLAGVKGSGGGRRWLRRRSFFFSPLLRCAVFFLCFLFSLSTRFLLPFSLTVAQGGGEERIGGGSRRALRVLGCCCGSSSSRFYSSPGFLSLGSVLFLFSLSGSAGVGSANGGGMAVLDGGGRRPRWRGSTGAVPSPGVRNGPSSSLCSDAQYLFFSSPCMLSLSLLCLPQKLLFLFRFLLCCCWWQLLLVTRQNDGGAASNGGGRETRERDELLFFSPILLFFCSFLLFSRQLKSSLLCSSTLLSFSKILPPSVRSSLSQKNRPHLCFLFSPLYL